MDTRSQATPGAGPPQPGLDWSTAPDPDAAAREQAAWQGSRERVQAAGLDTPAAALGRADNFTKHTLLREQNAAAPAPAKPRKPRAAKAPAALESTSGKPARVPRKKAGKQAEPTANAPAPGVTPAAAPAAGSSGEAPPATEGAIAYLANPNASTVDLFALDPASQAFVQYHLTTQREREAASALAYSRLVATAPTFRASTPKVADALTSRLPGSNQVPRAVNALLAAAEPGNGAYARPLQGDSAARGEDAAGIENSIERGPAPVQASAPAQAQVPVHAPAPVPVPQVLAGPALEERDARMVDIVLNNSRAMLAMPVESMTEAHAGAYAGADAAALGNIHDPGVRSMAMLIITKNRDTRPLYRAAFDQVQAAQGKAAPVAASWPQAAPAAAPAAAAAQPAAPATDQPLAVPAAVARQFDKVEQRYYFKDKSPAFEDRGLKLTTRGHHPQVVGALVAIAVERGWDSATVKGTEAFRRSAWMDLTRAGLQVAGYKPSEQDLIALAKVEPGNSITQGIAQEAAPPQAQTAAAAPPAPAKPVTPEARAKAADFMRGKPEVMVKKYPDLAAAYGQLDLARKLAVDQQLTPAATEAWVEFNRRTIKDQIERGEALLEPRITAAGQAKLDAPDKTKGGPDLGKSPRAKEVEQVR